MKIEYHINFKLNISQVIDVYISSGINRPVNDTKRIEKMYENSNLIISAWEDNNLIAVSRALTDFCYCCYLSDIAVRKEYQHKGIGKEMVRLIKEYIGDESMLLLLSADQAMDYYPKIGMEKVVNGFIFKRKK